MSSSSRSVGLVILCALLLFAIPVLGHGCGNCGKGHLWLEIVGGTYIGEHSDPWLNESYVTSSTNFTLNITYHKNNGNNQETVDHLYLLIAVNKDPQGVTIKINGTNVTGWKEVPENDYRPSICTCAYRPHGIFQKGVWYSVYEVSIPDGKFSPGESIIVSVSIEPSDVKVHFDAVGCTGDCNETGCCSSGCCCDCCKAVVFTPCSHDCTYCPCHAIPEFSEVAIPVLTLLGVIYLLRR
ncbi:MAG: hypothetical protein DRO98_02660 [Archaeoglobales archaeon]|nr:MAG: hypothetical protein DRO98_02660 [Archaeoglobales archaeon]